MKEIWKDIKNYEGIYQVSNLGNVKVLDRKVYNSKVLCKRKGRNFKLNKNARGYIVINLTKNHITKSYLLHRLVAQAFISNPENLPQVNHIDENKENNNVNNLEWCTAKYNINYSKKSREILQLDKNDKIIKIYKGTKEASLETKIQKSSIIRCCKGERKTAGGYKWKYNLELLKK